MTNPNGTRWDHDLRSPAPKVELTLSTEPARGTDGRWVPGQPEAAAPVRNSLDKSTTELAVTRARYPEADVPWDPISEHDAAFEAASSRFFETDPGNRLTYDDHRSDVPAAGPADAGPVAPLIPESGVNGTAFGGNGHRDLTVLTPSRPAPQTEADPQEAFGGLDSPRVSQRPPGTGEFRAIVPPTDDVEDEIEGAEEDVLASGAAARRNAIEWAVVLVAAVLLALVLRALVLQAFYIPSPSMEDTLLVQDRVLVNKLSYRFGDVSRGDIVVFHRTDEEIAAAGPGQPKDVIKRVIAFGGETIEIRENTVIIDGQTLVEPYLDPDTFMPDFGPLTVPEGDLFVMGDNRGQSSDSRGELGPVAEERVVGRAFVLFWPLDRIARL